MPSQQYLDSATLRQQIWALEESQDCEEGLSMLHDIWKTILTSQFHVQEGFTIRSQDPPRARGQTEDSPTSRFHVLYRPTDSELPRKFLTVLCKRGGPETPLDIWNEAVDQLFLGMDFNDLTAVFNTTSVYGIVAIGNYLVVRKCNLASGQMSHLGMAEYYPSNEPLHIARHSMIIQLILDSIMDYQTSGDDH